VGNEYFRGDGCARAEGSRRDSLFPNAMDSRKVDYDISGQYLSLLE
jgi:hypothetical protein